MRAVSLPAGLTAEGNQAGGGWHSPNLQMTKVKKRNNK